MFTWFLTAPLALGLTFGPDAAGAEAERMEALQQDVLDGAQTLDFPRGEFVDLDVDSGSHDNGLAASEVVFTDVVHVEGAHWVRLHFADFDLGPGTTVRMTSILDGEWQELDAADLEMWNEASGYFNGDTVIVELVAGPGTVGNSFHIDRASVEVGGVQAGLCGICGGDSRTPSDEEWSGRILPAGCSGSVYNANSCVVSAGHCGGTDIIQFNVPNSLGNCTLQHPPFADQFPINQVQSVNGGVGSDWAVMTTGTNNQGQTIYERYGEFRPIAESMPSNGSTVQSWSYGASSNCTLTNTQQFSQGPVSNVVFNPPVIVASIDITFGSSGAGLLHNNEIVGIVTHCDPNCGGNIAQRIDTNALQNAINSLCPADLPEPPENDDCSDALAVGDGVYEFDTTHASTSGPDEGGVCDIAGFTDVSKDVWYEYTASCTGELTASLCDSQYVTKLAVYGDTCPTGPGSALACDVVSCVENNRSEATMNVVEGESYLIRVGGHLDQAGEGTLVLSCEEGVPCPADLTGDGTVGGADLGTLLGEWGPCADPDDCPADLTGSGSVGGADLGTLLGEWGPCD